MDLVSKVNGIYISETSLVLTVIAVMCILMGLTLYFRKKQKED